LRRACFAEGLHLTKSGYISMTISDNQPNRPPTCEFLSGPSGEAFCRRVAEAIMSGYRLPRAPDVVFHGERAILQTLTWFGA
jgi:hypothetical protein